MIKRAAIPKLVLIAAMVLLAAEPALWLLNSWQEAAYDSHGWIAFVLCVGLFVWSATSSKTTCRRTPQNYTYGLLIAAASVRLISQLLAINVIGALTLVIDVFALACLAELPYRKRAVSPFWLAGLFFFCLPLERIIQRSIGYGLQHLSADGACHLLSGLFEQTVCHGVRIIIEGQDVLVDLPCSGARALLLLMGLFCLLAATHRPTWKMALTGVVITLASSLVTNMLRITLLGIGVAKPIWPGGIDVMAQPWHDLLGLALLALGCVPVIAWARYACRPARREYPVSDQIRHGYSRALRRDGWWLEAPRKTHHFKRGAPVALFILALAIINLPGEAVDVSAPMQEVTLPAFVMNSPAEPLLLLAQEKRYFTQYGGSAAKAGYGDHNLLVVRTTSPLRHLHAPDECMRGLGFNVRYQGISYDPLPTAVYKAIADDGTAYRVAVTFTSENGKITTNISEAVWHWMQNPTEYWSAIQRIAPWDSASIDSYRFDHAVMTAFDLSPSVIQTTNPKGDL